MKKYDLKSIALGILIGIGLMLLSSCSTESQQVSKPEVLKPRHGYTKVFEKGITNIYLIRVEGCKYLLTYGEHTEILTHHADCDNPNHKKDCDL